MNKQIKVAVTLIAIAGAGLLQLTTATGQGLEGSARATDGDSLRMGQTRIRLHGIDAPEFKQTCDDSRGRRYDCGKQSRDALQSMVDGQSVRCEEIEKDQYGRTVARCFVGQQMVNEAMVEQGWALAYRRFTQDFVDEERRAKAARIGVWQGEFLPPSEWRARNR